MPGITREQSRSSLPVLPPAWHWGGFSLGIALQEQSLLLPLPHKYQQLGKSKAAQSAPGQGETPHSSQNISSALHSKEDPEQQLSNRGGYILWKCDVLPLCQEQENCCCWSFFSFCALWHLPKSRWALSELPKLLGFHSYCHASSRLLPGEIIRLKALLAHSAPQSFPNWFSICSYIFLWTFPFVLNIARQKTVF